MFRPSDGNRSYDLWNGIIGRETPFAQLYILVESIVDYTFETDSNSALKAKYSIADYALEKKTSYCVR
jgi:hypothetical protein